MVKELLLDNDTVSLPGLGAFVTEMAPAVFSDKGYTINPPYRKLYFRENLGNGDGLLEDLYARSNEVSREVASGVLGEFLSEVKDLLNSRKNVVLPGLGRLRATKENNYFFVPFENMDIYPDGVGLEPVSLKVRDGAAYEGADVDWGMTDMVEPADGGEDGFDGAEPADDVEKDEVVEPAEAVSEDGIEPAEAVSEGGIEAAETVSVDGPEVPEEESVEGESGIEVEGEIEIGDEGEGVDNAVETAENKEGGEVEEGGSEESERRRALPFGWKVALTVIGIVIGLAVVAFVVFLLLAHFAPDFTDRLLYTKEQLEILHYVM